MEEFIKLLNNTLLNTFFALYNKKRENKPVIKPPQNIKETSEVVNTPVKVNKPEEVVDTPVEVNKLEEAPIPQLNPRLHNLLTKTIQRVDPYLPHIKAMSDKTGIPVSLALSIIAKESAGNTNAVSSKKAKGLMQITEIAAKDINYDFDDKLFDPYYNITAGFNYLSKVMQYLGKTPKDLADDKSIQELLAAYNAGIGNLKKYGLGILNKFNETMEYVDSILNMYNYHRWQNGK